MSVRAQGFTLVELMVAVAVIGILASLAMTAYTDFVVRSRVSEVLTLADSDRSWIMDYFSERGTLPADATKLGMSVSADRSPYLTADTTLAVVGSDVQITYTLGGLGPAIAQGTLIFVGAGKDASLIWDCSGGTFPARFRPGVCR